MFPVWESINIEGRGEGGVGGRTGVRTTWSRLPSYDTSERTSVRMNHVDRELLHSNLKYSGDHVSKRRRRR